MDNNLFLLFKKYLFQLFQKISSTYFFCSEMNNILFLLFKKYLFQLF
jgi:hypothetical protein